MLGLLAIHAIVASCANMPQDVTDTNVTAGEQTPPAAAPAPPKHPLAYYHFLLGYQAEQEKDFDKAVAEYRNSLRRDPTSAFLKAKLASLYF